MPSSSLSHWLILSLELAGVLAYPPLHIATASSTTTIHCGDVYTQEVILTAFDRLLPVGWEDHKQINILLGGLDQCWALISAQHKCLWLHSTCQLIQLKTHLSIIPPCLIQFWLIDYLTQAVSFAFSSHLQRTKQSTCLSPRSPAISITNFSAYWLANWRALDREEQSQLDTKVIRLYMT